MIRTYKSGRVIEKSKFWVPAQARPRAGRVKNNTSAAKRDQNARRAVRTLARTINCNFGAKDLFVTATFDDGTPVSYTHLGRRRTCGCWRLTRR